MTYNPDPHSDAPPAGDEALVDTGAGLLADAVPDGNPLEKLDVAVAQAAAPFYRSDAMKLIGWASDISDQSPMRAVCGLAIAGGLLAGRPAAVRAGTRALLSHSVATWAKNFVKHRVDRTRPRAFLKSGRYTWAPGDHDEKMMNSFPSGHTAGAVAVARAFARDLPGTAAPGYALAALVSAAQVPRCMHYPSDIAVGAAVGWAAEWASSRLFDRLLPLAPGPVARALGA